jgi:FSR family fosmidomycin resistance protein-like MFS transporter
MPAIRDDLSLSYAEIGALLAVPAIAGGVVEPFLGVLGDFWRRQVVVGVGGSVYALTLAVAAASESYTMLLCGFVVMYPAAGAFVSLSQASLMDADPRARESNMVRWTIAGAVGGLGGPVVVAAALHAGAGWRPVFAGLAGLGLALVAVTRVNGPHHRDAAERPRWRDAARLVRRWSVLRWLLLLEASDLMLDVLRGFLAVYLVDAAGLGSAGAALALGATLAADLAGNAVLLRVLSRWSSELYLRASAAVAALLFVFFLLVPSASAKVGLIVALGFTTAGWYPLLQAGLYGSLPGLSGTAMALSSAMGPVAAVPPLAVGLVAGAAGLANALWLLLVGPLVLLLLAPRRLPDQSASGTSSASP